MKNEALARWRNGARSPGAWINLPDVHTAENQARMGFDWLCFDLQHGLLTEADLLHLLPAVTGTQATPIVRVLSNDAGQIGRALDLGAQGVIVPMVNSPEEAEAASRACRYPPDGLRSCGPMRGAMLEGFGYLADANEQIACIAMIETQAGLDQVEAIAATEGVDGLFIGPMDLCYGLGLAPGSFGEPAFVDAVARIRKACEVAGCAAGMFGYDASMAAAALDDGFQFASIGSDISFFREGAMLALSKAGGEDQPTKVDGPRY